MATKHTGNMPFHSRSNSIGSSRWQFTKPPVVPRGYILDLGFKQHLPNRWYAVVLVYQGSEYSLRVYGAGNDADCSLDDVDLQAVISAGPIINEVMNVSDEATALERLERGVAFVMHNLLDPVTEVAFIWRRIATTTGEGILNSP